MTDDTMPFLDALLKRGGGDFMKELAEEVLGRLMAYDVEGQIGAGRYERNEERTTQRNGYRHRDFDTRLGTLDLKIPKLRKGSYFPGFLEPRRTTEQALVAVIQEAWIQGVSTRSVDDLVQAMGEAGQGPRHAKHGGVASGGGTGISKSQVSRLCAEIDERVNAFLERPIEGDWPYLWLDATCVKVRRAGRIVSVAVTVAVGVNTDGRREVLGMDIGCSEAETFWTAFLRKLTRRGLRGVKLVISDAHEGLKAAATKVLGATAQRCRVYVMRNASARAGENHRQVVSALIATAFAQTDAEAARQQWRRVADQFRAKMPKPSTLMDEAEADVLAYMTFPAAHRTKLHSKNPLERVNGEIERRTDVVGIFPNEDPSSASWAPSCSSRTTSGLSSARAT